MSTDEVGHTTTADVQGAPFEFNAFTVQGVLHQDGFETDAGWTLQGDWEIGAPQGLGTLPGDPATVTKPSPSGTETTLAGTGTESLMAVSAAAGRRRY